jgi:hypothetical protein
MRTLQSITILDYNGLQIQKSKEIVKGHYTNPFLDRNPCHNRSDGRSDGQSNYDQNHNHYHNQTMTNLVILLSSDDCVILIQLPHKIWALNLMIKALV